MRVTIFGANGKVGRLVVEYALAQGHTVTAFVHSHPLPEQPNLTIFKGDIYQQEDVAEALKGAEVVISALGSWGTPRKDVLTSAMHFIIPAMESQNIARIISLTGSDAEAPHDTFGLLHRLLRPLLKLVAPKILADGEAHIQLLAKSKLEWTVVRSPVMTNFGTPSHYKLGMDAPSPWAIVNRRSVALALVQLADSGQYTRRAPFIHQV